MRGKQAAPEEEEESRVAPWWRRSPPLAAGAGLAIGAATLWFGGMLSRVPLDQHSTLGYLLMLPLLLTVPAFSAAGLRLAWLSASGASGAARIPILLAALIAAAANLLAIARFATALVRIFAA